MTANDNAVSLSLFQRCNAQADANKAAQWERIQQERDFCILKHNGRTAYKQPGKDWWQDKDLWAFLGPYASETETEAIQNIFRQCGGKRSDIVDLSPHALVTTLVKEVIEEDKVVRYHQHQLPLREHMAERGRTLEWVQLNPTDTELTRFEVPLEQAG